MSARITRDLTLAALEIALLRRCPPPGLLHHLLAEVEGAQAVKLEEAPTPPKIDPLQLKATTISSPQCFAPHVHAALGEKAAGSIGRSWR